METALVLGDIGKSRESGEGFLPLMLVQAPDHDDFAGEVMEVLRANPSVFPDF